MPVIQSGVGTHVEMDGGRFLYFAGNNYLGLANNSVLKNRAIACIKKYGLSFSASRETTGTSGLHLELEKLLSKFKNAEDSVIFASGYLGNKILLAVLQDRISAVFADRSAHPSTLDGIPSAISKVYFYEHCDAQHLENLLQKKKEDRPLIITDGIFALTGEIAPLDLIYPIARKYHATLVVDDAHATGILGEHGRGTPEHFRLDGAAHLFQTETMSKAFGTYGGFISSSAEIITTIRARCSAYIGSTALPPPIVAAGIASVRHFVRHPELRSKVLENASYLKSQIHRMHLTTSRDPTPIVPIFFSNQEIAQRFSRFLYDHHIIAPAIRYPVHTDQFLVRMSVSARHTKKQITRLLKILEKWRNENVFDNHQGCSH